LALATARRCTGRIPWPNTSSAARCHTAAACVNGDTFVPPRTVLASHALRSIDAAICWFDLSICSVIACQASPKAASFSAPMRWNSRWSLALGLCPASAMRPRR
jgi:hypothetical protein